MQKLVKFVLELESKKVCTALSTLYGKIYEFLCNTNRKNISFDCLKFKVVLSSSHYR